MRFFFLLILISFSTMAQNLSKSFPAGAGSTYKITMKNDTTPIFLSLYVAGTRVDSLHIEYFMEARGLMTVQLWQQFEIGVTPGGAEIRKGFVMSKDMTAPEPMPAELLKGAEGGIQVNNFLFPEKEKLNKDKVGEETVEIAAGTTKATHYRTVGNGQTIDYWISDDAKPMGLVMLVSKNEKKPDQNYTLELTGLMENVKAKIVPEKAVPLSDKGRALLARPASLR